MRTTLFTTFLTIVAVSTASQDHDAPNSMEVYGSIHETATYMVDLVFGKPVTQRQSLIIDTGSSVLAFACNGCGSGCGVHQDPKFELELSETDSGILCNANSADIGSTCNQCGIKQEDCATCLGGASLRGGNSVLHEDKCAYTIRYLEGSHLNGLWYSDVCWLGHGNGAESKEIGVPVRVPFGCHIEETNLFLTQKAAGIIGLEKQSAFGPEPFIQAALRGLSDLGYNRLPLSGFSVCLSQQGGLFSVGKINNQYHVDSKNQRSLNDTTERKDVVVSAWMPVDLFMYTKAMRAQQSLETMAIDSRRALQTASDADVPPPPEGSMIMPVQAMSEKTVVIDGYRVDKEIPADASSQKQDDAHKFGGLQWVDVLPGDEYHLKVESFGVGSRMFHPQHAKTGERGMIALLDSGTTIFYLRWIIYAETVFEIENVVTKSIKQQIAQTVSDANVEQDEERIMVGHPAATTADAKIPMHLSGWTFDDMKRVTDEYLTNITRVADYTDIMAESVLLPEFRSHGNSDGNRTHRVLKPEEEVSTLRAMKEALESYAGDLRVLRQKLDDMEQDVIQNESAAGEQAEAQGRRLAETERTWLPRNTLRSIAAGGGRVSAEVKETLQSLSDHPSAHQRSTLSISKLNNSLGEECWTLPNGDEDLKHFPKIVIIFGGGVEFMWEPSSYLYRKGTTQIFCLAIAPQGLDPNEAESSSESAASMMHLFGHEAVLGSSFFINHDVVFDLQDPLVHGKHSGGRVAFARAVCPTYKLGERPPHSALPAEMYNEATKP